LQLINQLAWKDPSYRVNIAAFVQEDAEAALQRNGFFYAASLAYRLLSLLHGQRAETSADSKEPIMNWDRIEGNWKQFKGNAKEQWGKLTDDELDAVAGRREVLSGKIQEQYGISKEQAEQELADFERQYGR
jgi:uncharacterized protein YjbJ (UPF0337 family)